ncbi:MAG: hypothetical protein H6684_16970, partial [Deltaproteobacteria bacterium]|nr:hypothetical protein [Deltaproteobacteria bacterium]
DDDDDDDDDDTVSPAQLQLIENGVDVCAAAYLDCDLTNLNEEEIRYFCSGRFEHFKHSEKDLVCFKVAVDDYVLCVESICDPCTGNCTDANIIGCTNTYIFPAQNECVPAGDDDTGSVAD